MCASKLCVAFVAVLSIPLAGCADGHAKAKDNPQLPYAVYVSNAGKVAKPAKGVVLVQIEIGAGVKYVQSSLTTGTGDAQSAMTINDHPLEVGANDIRIGPRRYGPVKVGDHVVIDADGVRINGTLNGPLP